MDKDERAMIASVERRHELAQAAVIDSAIAIAAQVGVGPALEFMAEHGLERGMSLRVLTSPEFHRR